MSFRTADAKKNNFHDSKLPDETMIFEDSLLDYVEEENDHEVHSMGCDILEDLFLKN